jgi:hypothetical protein
MLRELLRQLGLAHEKKRKKSKPRFIKHPQSTYTKQEWKEIKKMSRDYGRLTASLLRDEERR